MSTYFHGNPEMQGNGDALQTLILMNPATYVGYTDNQHHLPPPPPANFMFFNNSTSSHIHHFNGLPLQESAAASSPQHQDTSDDLTRFHYNLYNPQTHGGAAREATRAKQGLSLSLSSQQPAGHAPSQGAETAVVEARVFGGAPDNVVLSCKYLKAAQQLLDEVVSIGKEEKISGGESSKEEAPKNTKDAGDGGAKRTAELTTAEKQEIQMKKSKLVDMLDEVEQRYKQYEQQMQMVTSWFEEAGGGVGSAKAYTALALQTISKQFRCLKDAIMAQIGAASRNLGEEDKKMEGSSRLKYIDNQIRQQRALQQQFGIIQNNAWRPQRGLPERSVSVLRAWLFQHFLHPYPKDTDKIMLAKQAGLTRSQVSNWFINARVRLWKPMVEEMYSEEIKGKQINGSIEDKTEKTEEKQVSTSNTSEMDSIRNPKKPRNAPSTIMQAEASNVEEKQQITMRFGFDERQSREGFSITGAPANFFGTYPIMGVEQFQPPYSSNGVSLTLGLQHCDNISNQNRSIEGGDQRNDFGTFNAHNTTTSGVYDNINDVQKTRQQDLVYNY